MATTPTFRSLSTIVSEMVQSFLCDLDTQGIAPSLQSLRPGSPYLAIFESVGQSQFRNQAQTLALLDAGDLDMAVGRRLDTIGAAEKLPRRGATFASGFVNIADDSFSKISSRIFQGKSAPIPGTTVIYVTDASLFGASGFLYIGRGTANLEGPLSYTATANIGSYWSIALSAPTTMFHGLGETVTFAQGGDRYIPAGTAVSTPLGNVGDSANYITTTAATLLDGEVLVADVPIVSRSPGLAGNASALGVRVVPSPLFAGMVVSNPLAIANGLDVERDDLYRERLRSARRARSGVGTPLGLTTYTFGVSATDNTESARVTSSQYVNQTLLPSLLVVDDGSGYEAKDQGIDYEVLMDSATGGERIFVLNHIPVAKASVVTLQAAPYSLADQATMTVKVGGITYTHTFVTSEFSDISNATAYEVVASINSDSNIPFSARTSGSGRYVAIFAPTNTNDDIEVIDTVSGVDANSSLQFPSGRVDVVKLYKNDILLSKDGLPATVTSNNQAEWSSTSSGETLIISVDGTPSRTYTITDADFIALGLGFTVVSSALPLAAWASVFNNSIPGIACAVSGASLVFTSNSGSTARASIEIDPASTLVVKGVLNSSSLVSNGRSRDYVVDRNRGQIELVHPLDAGDRLTAGTQYTRAYIQSTALGASVTVPAGDANLWVVVDGDAEAVTHSLNTSHRILQSWTNDDRRFAAYVGAGVADAFPFINVQIGDWAIWSEDAWNGLGGAPSTYSVMRVSEVDDAGQWFVCDYPTAGAGTASGYNDISLPVFQRLHFARTNATPQQITVAAGTYTQAQLVDAIDMVGGTASAVASCLRMTTNTYDITGDIALAAQDINASGCLGLLVGGAVHNDEPEAASVISGRSEIGTPSTDTSFIVTSYSAPLSVGSVIGTPGHAKNGYIEGGYWLRAVPTATVDRWGTLAGDMAEWTGESAGDSLIDHLLVAPRPSIDNMAITSRYRVGPLSNLLVVFDQDPVTKGYTVPMSRRLTTDMAIPYGASIRLLDADNLDPLGDPQSIALAFGTDFDFSNFALHGHGRSRLDLSSQPSSSDVLMLRLKSWVGRNDDQTISLQPPLVSESTLTVANIKPLGSVVVYLASDTARSITITPGDKLLCDQAAPATTATMLSAFSIANISRGGGAVVTVTLDPPTGDIQSSLLAPGDTVWVECSDVDYPSGYKVIASASASFPGSTFTYTEAGADSSINNPPDSFVGWSDTPIDFTGVLVDDYLALPASNGNYWDIDDAMSATRVRLRVTSSAVGSPLYWVQFAATTVTPDWKTVISASDLEFFPLVANTTNEVVSAINALSASSITAALADGPGTGLISYVDDLYVSGPIADSLLHIRSAAYNATPGIENYDIELKLAPDATLTTTPNDWGNEEFRLVPTTANNVVDYLLRGQLTGLTSAGGAVDAAARGHSVQLASGTLGSQGAMQVTGGTANSVRFSALSAFNSSPVIAVSVPTSDDIEAISHHAYAMLNNASVLPKILDWTSPTTLAATAGTVVVGGAGSAWGYAVDPSFGAKWLWDHVGDYSIIYPTVNAPTLTGSGAWVHFEEGYGKWRNAGARGVGAVGCAYATLADGRVLAIGGTSCADFTSASFAALNVVEAYDPTVNAWYTMEPLPTTLAFGSAITLQDGTVLYTGGVSGTGPAGPYTWSDGAWIFDPTAGALGVDGRPIGTWTPTSGGMTIERSHHTTTMMSDGRVVVVGGAQDIGTVTNTSDIYDPATGTFTVNPNNMARARAGHYAVGFGVNQILVVGGVGAAGTGYEVYTLSTQVWTDDQPLGFGETRIGHAVVPLTSSTFLVIGGAKDQVSVDSGAWTDIQSTCEIYNLATHTTATVGQLRVSRAAFGAAKITNGQVVCWGGLAALPAVGAGTVEPQRSSEVFDVTNQTWSFASGTANRHIYAPPLLVSGDTVVIAEATSAAGLAGVESDLFDADLLAAPAGNVGTFRLFNVSTERLMIEAPDAEPGEHDYGYVAFYTYDSIMPGDTLRIATSTLGTAPQGSYEITGLDLFLKDTFTIASTTTFATGALGSQLPLVTVQAKNPARMLYLIHSIVPDDDNPNQTILGLVPMVNVEHISAAAGSVLTVQDKLEFPTSLVPGQDGYRYHTGLIAEVSRVVYGDERDVITYPGYAAAGATIDVAAPLIRRVLLSLAIRTRSGAVNVVARAQSAAAKVINSAPPGPIAISSIVEAVQGVDGILSVVMLSPIPTTNSDSIPVQPYEKALIFNPTTDIQISFIS